MIYLVLSGIKRINKVVHLSAGVTTSKNVS